MKTIVPPPPLHATLPVPKPIANHDTFRDTIRIRERTAKLALAREIVALAHHVDVIEVDAKIDADVLGRMMSVTCLLPERALHLDMQRTRRVCEMACGCIVHVCAPTHDTDPDELELLDVEPEPTDGGVW
jgi:hypothetical protein